MCDVRKEMGKLTFVVGRDFKWSILEATPSESCQGAWQWGECPGGGENAVEINGTWESVRSKLIRLKASAAPGGVPSIIRSSFGRRIK